MVEQYKKRHGWVLRALEADGDSGIEFNLVDALPDLAPEAAEAALADLKRWLKALPLSRRPLCKARALLQQRTVTTLRSALALAPARPLPPLEPQRRCCQHYSHLTGELSERFRTLSAYVGLCFRVIQTLQGMAVVALEDAIRVLQSMLPPPPSQPLPLMELENVAPSILNLGSPHTLQATAVVAPEDAIRVLQSMLPPAPSQPLPPVELENVAPSLLLPPAEARARSSVVAALAGGSVELGDRVACLRVGGAPPFGARGTVCFNHPLKIMAFASVIRGLMA